MSGAVPLLPLLHGMHKDNFSGIIYHVTNMANSLLVDHVRKELMAYLN
jgi:hypothetical protein